ncbi:Crp/Fnr family transcriptional regulator [Delftia tsuruhatensis]|uniref:Crp/Fnr family transcriptional regulator n=1 Tax=Delftia tsuruhatensis TaxID=180282 RepID=UPI001D12ADAD|nr:Crp/Fnr family transcriptional regulator [Delftia tsuruhatensis]
MLGNAPVPVDLVADGDVEVLVLPRQPLLDFLERDAPACLAVARLLSLRVNGLLDTIFISSEDTLHARVWATLQVLAAENGQPLPGAGGRTLLRISQGDLSHVVGASRQRVNEELRKLQAGGSVRLGYRWIEVLG